MAAGGTSTTAAHPRSDTTTERARTPEQRARRRAPVRDRAAVRQAEAPGRLVNLSTTGAYVETDELPGMGVVLRLLVQPRGDRDPIAVRAEVAWLRTDPPSGFGARLIDACPELLELLERHVEQAADPSEAVPVIAPGVDWTVEPSREWWDRY